MSDPIPGTTCFAEHLKRNALCKKSQCKHNIPGLKCSCVIAASNDTHHKDAWTLEEIIAVKAFGLKHKFQVCGIVREGQEKLRLAIMEAMADV